MQTMTASPGLVVYLPEVRGLVDALARAASAALWYNREGWWPGLPEPISHYRRTHMDAQELLQQYAAGERDFSGANLEEANLEGADLRGTNLHRVNLRRAYLRGASLSDAMLSETDLSRSSPVAGRGRCTGRG